MTYFVPWAEAVGKSKYPILRMTGQREKSTTYFVPWAETVGKYQEWPGQNTEILKDALPDGELSIILSAKVNITKFNDFWLICQFTLFYLLIKRIP